MIQRKSLGPGILIISLILGTVMLLVTALSDAGPYTTADRDTLLPGPELWGLPYV